MAGERLLLVDDEENLRSMLDAALRHSGFDVVPVGSGREALDAVLEGREPERSQTPAVGCGVKWRS